MTRDELLAYCLAKPGAWSDQPWEGDYVAKVADKIFAFTGETSVGVKAGANRHAAYIGRSGWNSLRLDGAIPDEELRDAVDASYELVVAKLPKKQRP